MNDIMESVKKTLTMESEAILEVRDSIDLEQVAKAVELISACRGKIITSGCGTSGAASRKIAHTFSCIECPALFLEPSDAVHGGLGVVRAGDIVILLSKGGVTTEILHLIEPCKKKKAVIIGVTENTDSQLGKECDLLLQVKISHEPDRFDMLATASILATLALFDAIAIGVMDRNGFTKEKFGVIHPGGAVGEKLLNKSLY